MGAGGDSSGTGKTSAALAYVGLWSAQILCAKSFVSRPHSLLAVLGACLAAELLKLTACGAALRSGPGALIVRAWADVRAGEQGATLLAVSACYSVYNVMSFLNLSVVPASVYKAVLSVRLAFAVGLDAARTGRCPAHRLAGALSCAAAAVVVSPFHAEGSLAFVAVCAQAFLSALAGALTQRILQRYPPGAAAVAAAPAGAAVAPPSAVRRYLMDLAERNASLYVATSAALTACLAVLAVVMAAFGSGRPAADAAGGSRVWALALSVALSAAAGLSTSHLLTVAGNVAKAMLAGAEVCAVTLASAVLFGEQLTWRIAAGAAFTLAGFALHERVLPLPPALLQRLPPALRSDDDHADGAKPGDGSGVEPGCTGVVNRAWLLFAAVAAPALLVLAAWQGLWLTPPAARLGSYVVAMDAPLSQCAAVPVLWAPHSRGRIPRRYHLHQPHACPPPLHFYSLEPAEHGGTLLRMNCSGGEARYSVNFLDDAERGRVAHLSHATVYVPGPGDAPINLSHKVSHLELTCVRPGRGRRAPVTAREVAILQGPMARRLQMAGDAAKAAALAEAAPLPMARRPNVVVLLMDALSRDTAESMLPDFLATLRRPGVFGSRVSAVEFPHLNIVGMSSPENWGAMLCGGNCSGPGARGAALPLLDAARGAGFGTMLMNNFCPPYPYPYVQGGVGPEVNLPDRYVCMHPGFKTDCRMRDSVSHSWLRAGAYAVAATRATPAPPVFAVIAPHEAHPKGGHNYDRLRRLEPVLIEALMTLNATGVLENSLVLLTADHGLHYGLRKEVYAPAAEAHRGPLLWMLMGHGAGAALFGAADDAGVARGIELARANAQRLVTMHDLYRTMADAAGLTGAGAAPEANAGELRVTPHAEALNLLTEQVPEDRTCRTATIPDAFCGCLQRKRGLFRRGGAPDKHH